MQLYKQSVDALYMVGGRISMKVYTSYAGFVGLMNEYVGLPGMISIKEFSAQWETDKDIDPGIIIPSYVSGMTKEIRELRRAAESYTDALVDLKAAGVTPEQLSDFHMGIEPVHFVAEFNWEAMKEVYLRIWKDGDRKFELWEELITGIHDEVLKRFDNFDEPELSPEMQSEIDKAKSMFASDEGTGFGEIFDGEAVNVSYDLDRENEEDLTSRQ